jgi:hypothetical protein
MPDDQRLPDLLRLAGDLFPRDGASWDDLALARRLLVRAMRRGQDAAAIATGDLSLRAWPRPDAVVDDGSLAALRDLLAEADNLDEPTVLVLRRTLPDAPRLSPKALPDWARGRLPSRTLGPFVEATTRPVWFDVFETTTTLVVMRQVPGGSAPLLALSRAQRADPRRLDLDPGAIWIRARAADTSAPEDAWFGVAIAGGRISADQPFDAGPAPALLLLSAAASLRIDLDLAPQGAIAAGAGPLGGDAAAAVLGLPAGLRLELHPAGLTATLPGDVTTTLFGADLRFGAGAAPPRWSSEAAAVLIPLDPAGASLAVAAQVAASYALSGTAPVAGAALAFPAARLSGDLGGALGAAGLGLVEGTPALHLALGEGLRLAPTPQQRDAAGAPVPARLDAVRVLARAGELWLSGAPAGPVRAEERLVPLWDVVPAEGAELRLDHARATRLSVSARAGAAPAEALRREGLGLLARLGRPATAAGGPIDLRGAATAEEVTTPEGSAIRLRATEIEAAFMLRRRSFVLENGLLRTVAATGLLLEGIRAPEGGIGPGWMTLRLLMDLLVPTLPDPYASDFLPWETADGAPLDPDAHRNPALRLVAAVDWRGPRAEPETLFGLEGEATPLLRGPGSERTTLDREEDDPLRGAIEAAYRGPRPVVQSCRLLDVSGAADHRGVALLVPAGPARGVEEVGAEPLSVDGMALTLPLGWVDLLMLPGFQNEVLANLPPENAVVDPFPDVLDPLNDGGPQLLRLPAAARVPVTPRDVAAALVQRFGRQGSPRLLGLLSLPFGIRANAELDASQPNGGAIELVEVQARAAEPMEGAWQLRLRATGSDRPGVESPSLPGSAHQLRLGIGGGDTYSALGQTLEEIFNDAFSAHIAAKPGTVKRPRIPVTALDVAGQGNSVMSAWRNLALPVAPAKSGVREVRFEALVGRVAFEVVQVVAICHPWSAPFVRDVTLRRNASGSVWRSDSGWKPAGDALIEYPNIQVERGPVRALRQISNIREIPQEITDAQGMRVRAVRFDAMAELADHPDLVPVRDVEGWLQIAPTGDNSDLSAAQVIGLLRSVKGTPRGPVCGRLDLELPIGGSGPTQRAVSLSMEAGGPGVPGVLCGTLRGSLAMPPRGTWMVTRRDAGAAGHRRLGPQEMLPVIGQGAQRRIREPADLLAAQPDIEYGIVHASDAHRLLLRDPVVEPGSAALTGGRAPLVADGFALAGRPVVVPDDAECIALPAATALRVPERGHLLLDLPGGEVEVTPSGGAQWRSALLDQQTAGKGMRLDYRDLDGRRTKLRLAIDTREAQGPHWTLELNDVVVTADLDVVGEFMSTRGTLRASSLQPMRFEQPEMRFTNLLAPVQGIMDLMKGIGVGGALLEGPKRGPDAGIGFAGRIAFPPFERKPGGGHLHPGAGYLDTGAFKLKGSIAAAIRIRAMSELPPVQRGQVEFELAGKMLFPTGIPALYGGGTAKVRYEYSTLNVDPEKRKSEDEETRKKALNPTSEFKFVAASTGSLGIKSPIKVELNCSNGFVVKWDVGKGSFKFGLYYAVEGKLSLLDADTIRVPSFLGGLLEIAVGFEAMVIPGRVKDGRGQATDIVGIEFNVTLAAEVTLGWVLQAEIEIPFSFDTELGLPTLAAALFAAPVLLVAEPFI